MMQKQYRAGRQARGWALVPVLAVLMLGLGACGGGGATVTASPGGIPSSSSASSSGSSSSSSSASSVSTSSSSSSSSSVSSSSSSSSSVASSTPAPTPWGGSAWSFRGDPAQAQPSSPFLSSSISDSSPTDINLTTSGGGFLGYGEGFVFASREITGDFTLTATVASISQPLPTDVDRRYRLGVMLCDCVNGNTLVAPIFAQSALAHVGAAGETTYQPFFAARTTALSGGVGGLGITQGYSAANVTIGATAAPVPQTLLRLIRVGNVVTARVSTDGGATWESGAGLDTIAGLPATLRIGVFAATDVATTVAFRSVTITQP